MLIGIGIVAFGLVGFAIGFTIGRRNAMNEKKMSAALARIESRCVLIDQRVAVWMKHTTTLTEMPAIRVDPRRDPDD